MLGVTGWLVQVLIMTLVGDWWLVGSSAGHAFLHTSAGHRLGRHECDMWVLGWFKFWPWTGEA